MASSEYQRRENVERFSEQMQPRLPRISVAPSSTMKRETSSISGIHGKSKAPQVMSASFSGDFPKSLSSAPSSNFMPPLSQVPSTSVASAEDYMQKYHGRHAGERTISAGHVISAWAARHPSGSSVDVPHRRASSSVVESSSSRFPELKPVPAPLPADAPSFHFIPKPENVSMIDVPETDILDSSYSEDDDTASKPTHSQLNRDRESISSAMTDDSEFMELCERETIVERYDGGPDGKEVESWENPDFELYRRKDRYGFVHKDGSPTLETAAQLEKKHIRKEVRRAEKWARMLKTWNGEQPPSAKVCERVWKGIPESVRQVAWMQLLGVRTMKAQAREYMYRDLLKRARLLSKDIKQIDLDINRTYRDHVDFRRRYDLKQRSLFNVLAAYAMFNTEIGYCQGMSQIAALFLMYMDEEDAFWSLHSLMVNKKYHMHGFFAPGFPKLQRFQAHYEKVLHSHLPRIKKHLDKAGIPPIYLTKWWFGCFLDRVPFSLALRIWDVFLLEGDSILIAMAYTIMKMHRKTIKNLDIEAFMNFIQTDLSVNFGYPDDEVMEELLANLKKLQSDRVAVPPPPGPDDLPEAPTKPLAPILTRSMMDIRMDIAEIQSRGSRANSMGGRSPAVVRRRASSKAPPSLPTPVLSSSPRLPPIAQHNPATNLVKVDVTSSESSTPPIDPIHRRYSSETHQHLAEQSTSNGIEDSVERMKIGAGSELNYRQPLNHSRITANRQSFYDNVPPPTPTSYTEKRLTTSHPSGNTRVQHMPNHITYITVGEVDELPPRPNGLAYHHSHITSTPKRTDISRFSSTKEKHTMI
uniref:Rab-GAP TBC domain-containing protein n=1 Tax=Steinernema glaseri TaxID=37863 RepID=A0A1I8AF71_9BILA